MKNNIKLSELAKSVKLGIYEHYKGGRYALIGIGVNSEDMIEQAIYQAQYGENIIWVRPLSMFLDQVDVVGVIKERFKYVDNN